MKNRKHMGIAPHLEQGARGEQIVVHWLEAQGFTVLGRNVRTRSGEIDIVVSTVVPHGQPKKREAKKKERLIYIIEVKTRATELYGSPVHAVGAQKFQRILRVWNEAVKGRVRSALLWQGDDVISLLRSSAQTHVAIAAVVLDAGGPKLTMYWNVGVDELRSRNAG